VSPWTSLGVVGASFLVIATVALRLLASGYKLRH
jgi:ABC-2 type transport system permease protein